VNGGFLLDTNIPSELMRPRPEPRVQGWVAAQDISALFLSVVSGELEMGFTTMQDAARKMRLEASLERHLVVLFPGRVLPVTQTIAARVAQTTLCDTGTPLLSPQFFQHAVQISASEIVASGHHGFDLPRVGNVL
jgi:predicted nucleic acid-binding protein